MSAARYDERVGIDPSSPWWAEHRSRYWFASAFVNGLDVLDIATGSGLGADILLAGGAATLVGVDVEEATLRAARHVAPRQALCRASGEDLPFPDATFGMVSSFETIEHVAEPERFLSELARVLRPDGRLILSTPNATFTEPVDGRPRNPFHRREYEADELRELLHARFADVSLRGQRPAAAVSPCPYWDRPGTWPPDLRGRVDVALWKAIARLPPTLGRRVAPTVLGRPLHPGEHDFTFEEGDAPSGHVLLAVCGSPR